MRHSPRLRGSWMVVRESLVSVYSQRDQFSPYQEVAETGAPAAVQPCRNYTRLQIVGESGGWRGTTCIGRLHTTMNNNRYAQTYYDKEHIHFFDLQNACPHTLTPELEKKKRRVKQRKTQHQSNLYVCSLSSPTRFFPLLQVGMTQFLSMDGGE
jgi:hypothetical protein